MNGPDLPPLSEEIAEEMQALKHLQPPPAVVEQAFARLDALEQTKKPPAKLKSIYVPIVAIAMAAVAMVVGRQFAPQTEDVVRFEERVLSLPESGHAWTALDLQTHHHDGQPAIVHLEVPTHVRVSLPSATAANGDQDEQHCAETRCVHRFTQHHGKGVPLRIAVTHPGRYEIHVRHESKKAAMREHFVVTASRD